MGARGSWWATLAVASLACGSVGPDALGALGAAGGTVSVDPLATERALASVDPEHAPRVLPTGVALGADGGARALLDTSGARLRVGGRELTLRASALGRAGALAALDAGAPPSVAGPEVRTTRAPGVVEWWRSLPSGLEHGVTIAARPPGEGELVVELTLEGELRAVSSSDDSVGFVDAADGARVATYGHLAVLDAEGARVPARMAAYGGRIGLVVDDADAHYPLVVDPLVVVHEAGLFPADRAAGDDIGRAVSLSADGTRAILGAQTDDVGALVDAGSARVFVRTGTTWTAEATLLAPDRAADDRFGWSVSLSVDGSRALVGAPGDDTAAGANAGSVHVFTRTGTTWTAEAQLFAAAAAAGDGFGHAVALSPDGTRAGVSAPYDDTSAADTGTVHVFVRPPTGIWMQEGTLEAPDAAASDHLGKSLTWDGSSAGLFVGVPDDDTAAGGFDAGSVRYFPARSAAGPWQQVASIVAADGDPSDAFGISVAASGSGFGNARLLVGASEAGSVGTMTAIGRAYVFVLTAFLTYSPEATLVLSDGVPGDHAGYAVALSSDGTFALLGARLDDTAAGINAGSVRVFVRTGTAWTEEATVTIAGSQFGRAVAIAADGTRALVGAEDGASGAGTGLARVYTIAPAPVGAACGGDMACASGFCTDGVCCAVRCGTSGTDCEACSAALTGGADGTCATLSATVAPTIVCRASTDVCDPAEVCSPARVTCPANAFAPASTECRSAAGGCDPAELCTGTSAACPADMVTASGVTCRGSVDLCDQAEVCDGVSPTCPGDVLFPAAHQCRPSDGICDVPEVCSGTSPSCPIDTLRDATTVCRPAINACDLGESCTGTSALCPPDLFASATTACGPLAAGECDAPDHCSGDSPDCVVTFLVDVVCNDSDGECDPAELCSGAAATCPPDQRSPTGTVCRASTDTSCDPAESCDGTAALCPADVTTCMVEPDAGSPDASATLDAGPPDAATTLDAGPPDAAATSDADPPDASATLDAGVAPAAAEGCSCRASLPWRAPPGVVIVSALFAVVVRRRRR